MMKKNTFQAGLLIFLFPLLVSIVIMVWFYIQVKQAPSKSTEATTSTQTFTKEDFVPFNSAEDYTRYLSEGSQNQPSYGTGLGSVNVAAMTDDIALSIDSSEQKSAEPTRVSTTNVQVENIDEPDIVKTNGNELFISQEGYYYYPSRSINPLIDDISEQPIQPQTKVVSAFPLEKLATTSTIDQNGQLLLNNDTLIIFSHTDITAYDIHDAAAPKEQWKIDIADNSNYVTARLYDNTVYLMTSTYVDTSTPCPFNPVSVDSKDFTVACGDIYHPVYPVPANVTYTLLAIDAETGAVQNNLSYVGSFNYSTFYMSPENIYLAYNQEPDVISTVYTFMTTQVTDILPKEVLGKLKEVHEYAISDQSKEVEFGIILDDYMRTLSEEERDAKEKTLEEKLTQYYDDQKRDLEKTNLVKIDIDDLKIKATGNVPGTILNQFSLDEYKNHLRIATTVGQGNQGMNSRDLTVNDLYILDDELKAVGSIQDLGKGERIYSTRFMGETAYMVTFKETDPFFVFDLSDPEHPEKTGELKIPGYSAYLHKLNDELVLGIGKEGNKVKASLFSVKDPSAPKELAVSSVDEYWTDILNTHHAFLQDPKHQIFFMPGGNSGGYIFSYQNNTLELKKKIEGTTTQRAVFIDDYLYVIGRDKITVLSENTWETVKELGL